ncbi:MAG: glycosyltransferase [Candidatus Paceibacterota bacterium]|jgi:UDP:flavonoid glycosyltransferase YjiC (YdhE family)
MKIGIQTWGSNGDIRPLLALASGLKQAGHEITLVVSSIDNRSYKSECQALNINYHQVPEHISFDLEDFARRSFRMHALQWLKALLDEAFFPSEDAIYQAACQLGNENDVLIGHHFLYPLKLAAKQANKPFYSVTFCHAAIPDPAHPPFGFPDLGKAINPFSWKLLDAVFNWVLKKPLTRLWKAAGFDPPVNILTEYLTSQTLNLVAVDPEFCSNYQGWPKNHQVCGFLNFTEDADHWEMPVNLSKFLSKGLPPVYMTFGSIQQAAPEWSMDLFLEAVALSGCRAIIQTSSPKYPADTMNEQVYFIGRHPHQPVFKHCAAVVHHGGAGTTHAATRSGCPSIVIPFMDEQLFWGRQLQQLNLAGKPLLAKTVTAAKLANGLKKILTNCKYKQNAEQVSVAMLKQGGVKQAVKLIEMSVYD